MLHSASTDKTHHAPGYHTVHKNNTKITSPEVAMKAGIGYVSKNRDTESLVLPAGINDNIASTGFEINKIGGVFISNRKEKSFVRRQIDTSGRFDFSLGAVRLAATIIGGNIALRLGLNGIMVLICAMIFGFILSAFVGIMYSLTQIAPIVLSLAMTLLYESLGFFVFNAEGLNLLKASGDMSMVFNSVSSLLYHMGRIFQEQRPQSVGGMRVTVDSKLRRKIREKKIAMGHKPDDHEEEQRMS